MESWLHIEKWEIWYDTDFHGVGAENDANKKKSSVSNTFIMSGDINRA